MSTFGTHCHLSDRSDQLFSHLLQPLLRPLSMHLSLAVWTNATRRCMVCRRTCWGRFILCRTLPLVYSPAQDALTTSHWCCVNYSTLAANLETSGVRDCLPCAPVTGIKSAVVHVPHCWYSTRLQGSSFSSHLPTGHTRCCTDTL